jgi:Methane oxygenase PmoA
MMKKIIPFILLVQMLSAQTLPVKFISKKTDKKIEVWVGNQHFTNYIFPDKDVLKKPVLFPIKSAKGTTITRGYPLEPRANERVDHPHHVGLWLNYEWVNGDDFWNNSNTPPNPKSTYGTIVHKTIAKIKSGKKQGTLTVTADWLNKDNKVVLTETTEYTFQGIDNQRIIDRKTILTAVNDTVLFKDVKDGFFAIRVAHELEHPSKTAEVFTDNNGVETKVAVMNNEGVTGSYRNSEGVEGEAVWSKQARWVNLRGQMGAEKISIALFDHPQNVGYPAHFHARGYGLFAINPLGKKVFTEGKEALNLRLEKGQSVTFQYRVVITSGETTDDMMNQLAKF